MTKIAGSGSIGQSHGSADPDPDPHQHVMDPEHWSPQNYPVAKIHQQAIREKNFVQILIRAFSSLYL
jgi:hypothetical protein